MADNITKYDRSGDQDYHFSILIPTWNNMGYLENCIESIHQHSNHNHQIIVFINEGKDGTLEWLRESRQDHIDFMHSPSNVGICHAVNIGRTMAKADYLVYMNDDMYVLPGWDEELIRIIQGLNTKMFILSSTMIEPVPTGNNCVVVKDYGSDLDTFNKDDLLNEYHILKRSNWLGSTWPPTVVHVDTWDRVGGYSEEFSPGMYSDPDFSFKLLQAGARHFIGVGTSLVYHFGSKSTRRIQKNQGRKTFLAKWGISSKTFRKEFLKIGDDYTGPLPDPDLNIRNRFIHRVKRTLNI